MFHCHVYVCVNWRPSRSRLLISQAQCVLLFINITMLSCCSKIYHRRSVIVLPWKYARASLPALNFVQPFLLNILPSEGSFHIWLVTISFRECLLIDPTEHPMLLAEPSSNTQQQRERWFFYGLPFLLDFRWLRVFVC